MVECEFSVREFLFVPASGFNRYMVECEYPYFCSADAVIDVLIDTWWKVNSRAEDIILDKDLF